MGESCLKVVRNIASAYRGIFLFVSVSHQELHLYHTFGIKIGTIHPQIVILNITNEKELDKYVLDHDMFVRMSEKDSIPDESELKDLVITEEKLHKFLQMYLSKELVPYYRSEEDAVAAGVAGGDEETIAGENSPSGLDGESEEERIRREGLLPVHVTSRTLREKVIENTETVLLFVTAPW
jgi:hypothetical protein